VSFSITLSNAEVAGLSERAGRMKYATPGLHGNGWIFFVAGKVHFLHGWGQWQFFLIKI